MKKLYATVTLLCSVLQFAVAQEVVQVEPQPLASNVSRLLVALKGNGQSLDKQSQAEIAAALSSLDSAKIQQAIDKLVVAQVTINAEERVSVKRGEAKVSLPQLGHRLLIAKVINQSASNAVLKVDSPSAGAVFAGTSPLSMQRQQQEFLLQQQNEKQLPHRFLDITTYSQPPMTRQLSGLEVEYVLLSIASSEAGKREAVLHFDIGDSTADLEHRNELPLLLEVQPAHEVELLIRDESGLPTIAKLEIRDSQSRVYPPQPKRLAPDLFFQPQIYRQDGESVLLPEGEYQVLSSRGPEYRVKESKLVVKADQANQLEIKLDRWIDPSRFGYFSGDHHIHAAGCAHYTSPTQGVTPEDMYRQVSGEGLNVGCVLTWGPCFEFQRNFFQPQAVRLGGAATLLKYDIEVSGFGSQALGHVCLLNLKDQTYPQSQGSKEKGWPTWTTPVMRWAKEQGGVTGYAHSASGLHIDPFSGATWLLKTFDVNGDQRLSQSEATVGLLPSSFEKLDANHDDAIELGELSTGYRNSAEQLPNYAIPEMNGVGAMEICVSTVAGVCDFISAMDTARIQEWNTWYHVMNCGFPLKVSGETDFPCMSSQRVGQGRVYVQVEGPLHFDAWCKGLAEGKSYVSDGYAHAAEFAINEQPIGGTVELAEAGDVRLSVDVGFAKQLPRDSIYGTQQLASSVKVGDTVDRHVPRELPVVENAKRLIEIVVNGQVAASREIVADGNLHHLSFTIPIKQSSWVAVRHFPQLHTNPINVIVDSKPIRASQSSARWCELMTKRLWENRQKNIAEPERAEAKVEFDKAIAVFHELSEKRD